MMSPDEIRERIQAALPGAAIDIRDLTGTRDHFEVRVVAGQFEGLGLIDRHRMVYGAVADVMGGALHALSIKTLTPAESAAGPA